MSLSLQGRRLFAPSFPRVSGDEPLFQITRSCGLPFSPRERG